MSWFKSLLKEQYPEPLDIDKTKEIKLYVSEIEGLAVLRETYDSDTPMAQAAYERARAMFLRNGIVTLGSMRYGRLFFNLTLILDNKFEKGDKVKVTDFVMSKDNKPVRKGSVGIFEEYVWDRFPIEYARINFKEVKLYWDNPDFAIIRTDFLKKARG